MRAARSVVGDVPEAVLVERRDLAAGGVEPAAHRMAILAGDERLRPGLADIVKARPVLPADQQYVAEPLVGDKGGAAAPPLDHRVGRGRHAVPDIADFAAGAALQFERAKKAAHRAEGAVLRGRRHLGDGHQLRCLVISEVVGEGAADIRRDAQAGDHVEPAVNSSWISG